MLAEQVRRLRPELKVLFTSGYTQNAIVHHGRLDAGAHFVGKPFRLDTLGRKLREALDGADGAAEDAATVAHLMGC